MIPRHAGSRSRTIACRIGPAAALICPGGDTSGSSPHSGPTGEEYASPGKGLQLVKCGDSTRNLGREHLTHSGRTFRFRVSDRRCARVSQGTLSLAVAPPPRPRFLFPPQARQGGRCVCAGLYRRSGWCACRCGSPPALPPILQRGYCLLAPLTSAGPVALLEQRGRPGDHFG
jgi:hypothetical protein